MATEVTNQVGNGPYPGDMDGEIIVATVDTDTNGDGSPNLTNVQLQGDYSGPPVATVDSTEDGDGGASVANKTSEDLGIEVAGSTTTSGTVDVRVLVWGPSE